MMEKVVDLYKEHGLSDDNPLILGSAEIRLMKISDQMSRMMDLRCALNNTPEMRVSPGEYVQLLVGPFITMTDTDLELRTNQEFIDNAKGDILIGGLGIGLLIKNLQSKLESGEVTSITIVEKNIDVITLVRPIFSDLISKYNIKLVNDDIFTWINAIDSDEVHFDTIYFDIWDTICPDLLEEGHELMMKYSGLLRDYRGGSYMNCWAWELAEHRFGGDHEI